MADRSPTGAFAALIPELEVSDLAASLAFWCRCLGFAVAYQRPEEGFVYLERAGAQVMLCARNGNWEVGPMQPPFGRGINFEIAVTAVTPLLRALEAYGWPLFRPLHTAWYRLGNEEIGNLQFLVQDPDGYLLRFSESLGRRPATT